MVLSTSDLCLEGRTCLVYLDANASTAPDPEVVSVVAEAMTGLYGNPSSGHHKPGSLAARAVTDAREDVGALVGAYPNEVIFTSGATESNNLALTGIWQARLASEGRFKVVVSATEHPAVLKTAEALATVGAEVVIAPVDQTGRVDLQQLATLVDEQTVMISVMAANNETGTINPIGEIVQLARAVGALVHTDATQIVGRLPFSMDGLDVDLASFSGHKMYGPRGVGALICRRRIALAPLLHGGGHERGRRAGTLNTPGIVGLGVGARLAGMRFHEAAQIELLRDRLHHAVVERVGEVALNGHATDRLPNTLNLRFHEADAEALMAAMPSVACSTGSACHSGAPDPSHVLLAMGISREEAQQSIRFSLSRTTTRDEIDRAVDAIAAAVAYVRRAVAVHG